MAVIISLHTRRDGTVVKAEITIYESAEASRGEMHEIDPRSAIRIIEH